MASNASDARDGPGTLHLEPQEDNIVCLGLVGEFDMANAASIKTEAEAALRAGNHLILDLSEATFVDSSVIQALFSIGKSGMAKRRIAVLQLGTATIVEKALKLTSFERALPRANNRSDAIRTIRQLAADLDRPRQHTLNLQSDS